MGISNIPQKNTEVINHQEGTMKAICIHEYGDAGVLSYENVPIPEVGPDEVLIKVHAVGVNPVDWKVRNGYIKAFLSHNEPGILGWDVSGTVEDIGSMVNRLKIGDVVFANPSATRNGAYAEYVVARSNEISIAPSSISLTEAAGIPLACQTAWMALFEKANIRPGQSILIHAASGGVGHFAVQLAKNAGAFVIGTCSKDNMVMVKSLGADEVIDYRSEDFSSRVRDLDIVLDTIGGETQIKSLKVLKKGGILVSIVGITNPDETKKYDLKAISFSMISCGSRLEEIAGMVDKGLLKVVIDTQLPLEKAREAHEISESHHASGKIILTVG